MAESIGITSQYLSDLERGLVGTSISTLKKICRELNVTSDYILFGNEIQNPKDCAVYRQLRYLPAHEFEIVRKCLSLILETLAVEPNRQDL